MHRLVRFTSVIVAVSATPLIAQPIPVAQPAQPPPLTIAATAVGETRVTPDRALIQVSVDSRGESAASAGAANRIKQGRVIEAVKAIGVASPQIRTAGYRVHPEFANPERGKAPKVTGYRASNTVQVEVRSIENIGRAIDAALGAGATNVNSVGVYASNTDSARREAVRLAVTKARGEAEAAATAAGGTLGTLIELVIDPGSIPRPLLQTVVATGSVTGMMGEEMARASFTPVEPGESLVMAVVRVRWQFQPGAR